MTKPKLLHNLPILDLTSETDYLGVIDKGDLIKEFLKANEEQFKEIKMFSLYGEWGSGKSSLMKYLQKELQEEFNSFFFEAWEFEKDENLAMSLLEFMNSKNIDTGEQFCDDLLKYGGRILRGLGKSVKLNIPLFPNGPELDLDMSGLIDEFSKEENISFYKALEKFKLEFVRFEDKITGGNKKFNIIFIDDLDRCEPEQVLNLLSAIKLFFTYGQKTIFFCGIDKKAVEQAVKTKYGKVVKASEYLEKIFDISFSMPEHEDVLKLISVYFDDREIKYRNFGGKLNEKITEFFNEIKFTNPRRLKKVLNKYLLLSNYKATLNEDHKFSNLIPNIIVGEEGNFLETILTLYMLCISEFHKSTFDIFNDLNLKSSLVKTSVENKYSSDNKTDYRDQITDLIAIIKRDFNFNLNDHKNSLLRQTSVTAGFEYSFRKRFFVNFIDANDTEFNTNAFADYTNFLNQYNSKDNKIDYLLIRYLYGRIFDLINADNLSNYPLSNFKPMIDKLL
jgi:hypothetical protein